MNTPIRFLALFTVALAIVPFERAATIDGTWSTQFDSQIGVQKYQYVLKADGEKLTGVAKGERQGGDKSDVAITEGKITPDGVFFVEPLKFQDFDLRIEYRGQVNGDEMKLTRKVGDFAVEELVAKRVKEAAKDSVGKPSTSGESSQKK